MSELDHFKELYEFAAKQVSESRGNFERYYKYTMGAVFVVAAVIIGGFYFLVGHEYRDIEASVSKKADAHFEQLDQEMRSRILARIDDEFRTDKMQEMIRKVAREETAGGLRNEISLFRRDLDSVRADLSRYAMPRAISPKQKQDLRNYLSQYEPRAPVTVKVNPSDPEAVEYASQILNAITAGEWEAHMDTSHRGPDVGLVVNVEQPGESKNPDPKHPTPHFLLLQAFRQAHIEVNGTGGAPNRPSYSLSVIVGHRPLNVIPQR